MALRRKKDGMTTIKENVDKFQNIVDGLDKGICLCEDEISTNNKTIETLTDKNETIGKSQKQASVFRNNLVVMLSPADVSVDLEKKEDK